jgi:hypothetical protein
LSNPYTRLADRLSAPFARKSAPMPGESYSLSALDLELV